MKLKLPVFLSLALMACFCPALVKAQINESNYFLPFSFPKSPTSAEFAKYGDYKVNLFTGLPDISIPLYTIQAGGLEVPVTLSYHASGIKVAQVATWCGLGWSISSGGTITRSIMGLPDDQPGVGLFASRYRANVSNGVTADSDVYYLQNVMEQLADTRPDIFSYDFPGHSGKFFFDPTNGLKPALIPFAPVQIIRGPGYTIVDEHGNKYTFGRTYTENTTTSIPGHTGSALSAWMLENMVSQNKRDTISFTYRNQTVANPTQTSNTDIIYSNVSSSICSITPYNSQYVPRNASYTNVSVGEQDPDSIMFKNGKVIFDLDSLPRSDIGPSPYGLKDIKVFNYNFSVKAYQLLKKIVFFKSYFTNGTQPRLRLDSIQVQDAAGGIIQHYRFDYNTSISMPGYDSPGIDYWGYNNADTISDNRVPRQSVTYQPYLNNPGFTTITIGSTTTINNRNPDSTKMQACVLTGIHYPTGGYTTFTYQTNRYLDTAGVLTLAGGLRVASIQSYDGINPTPIVKTYQYHTAQKNFTMDYSFFVYQQKHAYWATQSTLICQTELANYYVSNPRFDLDPYDGAPVVYTSVSEYIGTPGSNIGRTDYLYSFVPDHILPATAAGIPVTQSYFYQRGLLMRKKEYQRTGSGAYQVVRKDTSAYTAFPINPHNDVGLLVGKNIINEGYLSGPFVASQGGIFSPNPNLYNGFVVGYYDIASDDNYLTGTTTNIYDTNDTTKYTTSTVAYKYDDNVHQQVSRSYHTDSRGNINVTVSKYPADYLNGGTVTHNAVLDTMLNHNMQADVVEKWDSLKNVTTSLNAVTGGQLNLYEQGNMGAILPSKISTLSVVAPLTNFVPASIVSGVLTADSRYVQMISFDSYDAKNNITQYTPRNSTPVSVLWDYQYDLPIAQVKNSLNTNVAYTSFEANGQGNWSFIGTPQTDATAPDGLNSYSLSAGNITSPSLDNTKSYVVSYWSNSGAATVNSTTGTALRTSNGWTYYEHSIPIGTTTVTVSGTVTIDALRLYPAFAQMTTYTYGLFGLTNIADTKGQNSYFEYDPFQRLKNIKDWNGNIVKNYGYHTYDQTVPNNAVGPGTFFRNNCPAGQASQSTTYSVPFGAYYSSTQASADAEAIYDMNTNGQIKANTVCTCQTINFTLINATGLPGFQAQFTGPLNQTFDFTKGNGSAPLALPVGTYTLYLPGVDPFVSHTWTLGARTPPTPGVSATFTSVIIGPGSTDTFIKVQ